MDENKLPEKYPPFPSDEELTIENIIRQYPKTDSCELQTLAELREWQIEKLKLLFYRKQLYGTTGNNNRKPCI